MTDWNDYRFLLALDQTGSLSAAGRQLGVSQPTVSRRIAALEQALGVVLVQRLPDGHRLSAVGKKVCERARVIQQKADEIRLAVSDDRDQPQHQVVVAAPEGISAALLTPALWDLHLAHPDLVVEVMISNRPVDLRRQEADVAVRMGDPRDDTLIGRKVGRVEFGLFARRDLIDRLGMPKTEHDLARYPFIESTGDISHLPQAHWLRLASVPRMKTYGANSILNQLEAFKAGFGLLALPTYLTWSLADAVRILPETYSRFIDVRVLHHGPVAERPAVRTVLDFLVTSMTTQLSHGSAPGGSLGSRA